MKNLSRIVIAMCLAAVGAAAAPAATASAQEVQITGPLAGAPAVRRMRIYRDGRFQVQPFIGFTLQDEYTRTIFTGAQLTYHLADWIGVGVWGGFGAVHLDTGLTDEVVARGQTTDRNRLSLPTAAGFADQIGQVTWAAAPQLVFVPLRGKLSLFQKLFVDADFYLSLGAAFVGVEERADVTSNVCVGAAMLDACTATQTARASRVAIAPAFAAGLTMYASGLVGVSIEWRAMPFSWNTSGTDEAGTSANDGEFPDGRIDSADRVFHLNHMVNLGVTFYLPTEARTGE